jgi:hypothetical protein
MGFGRLSVVHDVPPSLVCSTTASVSSDEESTEKAA